jgi:2-aminoadipate transaminase
MLSFAGGLPDPTLFPQRAIARGIRHALASGGGGLQYSPDWHPLLDSIVQLMAGRGVACTRDQILPTSGAQQGLQILARLFVNPGDPVVLESVSYTGFRQALAPLSPRLLPVPTAPESGVDLDALAERLGAETRPALAYLVPDHNNPTGSCIELEDRAAIAGLAQRHAVPLIEDDPYGYLTYDGAPLPALASFDSPWTFYVGSLSKLIAPGLRLGWLVLPEELVARAATIREAIDLEGSSFLQRAAAHVLSEIDLEGHLQTLRQTYRGRRDAMLTSLETHFDGRALWNRPRGGMFVWLELDPAIDTNHLLSEAVTRERIAFVPGAAFAAVDGHARNCLRLSFSLADERQIEDGLSRLARLL